MHSSNVGDRSQVDWIGFDEDLISGRNPNLLNLNWFLVGNPEFKYSDLRQIEWLLKSDRECEIVVLRAEDIDT